MNCLPPPKLRFPKFDGKWTFEDLETTKTKIVDCEHKTAPYVEFSDYLVVRTSNIKNGAIDYTDIRYTTEEAYLAWTKRATPICGEILFTREAPAGESCLVPKNKKVCLGQRMVLLQPNEMKIQGEYLSHFLQSPKSRTNVQNLSIGTTVTRINIQDIKNIPLAYPVLTEQQKIADFLTAINTKISQLTEKHRLLKEYKKGVMQQLFSQQIRFKDDDGKAFPEWEEKAFGEFLILNLRKVRKPTDNFLALGVRSHVKGVFQKPNFSPDTIAMEELYVVKANDLVLSITFAWEGAIAIASKYDDGGLVSHRFPTFIFDKKQMTSEFFKHVITNRRLRYILGNISPGGAGRNRVLNKSDFLKIKWIIPSLEEQQKIAQFLQSIDKKIDAVANQVEQTQQFKKGLLQQMFV